MKIIKYSKTTQYHNIFPLQKLRVFWEKVCTLEHFRPISQLKSFDKILNLRAFHLY